MAGWAVDVPARWRKNENLLWFVCLDGVDEFSEIAPPQGFAIATLGMMVDSDLEIVPSCGVVIEVESKKGKLLGTGYWVLVEKELRL